MSEEIVTREAGDDDPDPLELQTAWDALKALSRGEFAHARTGPPWGTTPRQEAERAGLLTWAALALAGGFAEFIAREHNMTVTELLDKGKPGIPEAFCRQMSVAPKKRVTVVREMVRTDDNRIVRTVDL